MIKIITKKEYNELLDYKEKYRDLSGDSFTFYTSGRSKRAGLLQLSKEELVRIIFDLNNSYTQLVKNVGRNKE